MSIYRIPITKDTTISTWSEIPSLRNLGNAGSSQIVDVWAQYRSDKDQKFLTRFLAESNLTALQAAIADGSVPNPATDTSVSCTLRFFNINFSEPQAYEFTLQAFPITKSWQEGRGIRIDSFTNTGYASWVSASTTASWSSTGGDYTATLSATQYFNSGAEDLNINVREILVNWLTGGSNYGFLVKMDDTIESLTASTSTNTQYYRKSFHGRGTNYPNYAPYIQLEWNSLITDDRKIGIFGTAFNLYFYNSSNGNYSDIDGILTSFPGKVSISGSKAGFSGSLSAFSGVSSDTGAASANKEILGNLTASRIKRGIYRLNFTLPNTSSIFNTFTDVWSVTSAASAATLSTGLTFYPVSSISGDNSFVSLNTSIAIPNWRPAYSKESTIVKKVYFFEQSGNVIPLAQSERNSISSIASSTLNSYISTSGWWRIITDPLGIVDLGWQRLEYDGDSNFFTLDFSNFKRGVPYKMEFKLIVRGETIIFDDKNGARPFHFEILE